MTQDNEPFLYFIAERCELRPEAKVARTVIRKAYEEWCEAQKVEPASPRDLAGLIRALGCADTRTGTLAGWQGILLLDHVAPRDPEVVSLEEYTNTRVLRSGSVLLKSSLYDDYLAWCKDQGIAPATQKRLSHMITKIHPHVRASSSWNKHYGASQPTWVGLSLRSQTRSLRLA